MEKVIPWDTGGGNLHLSYTGQGSGDITIWSDTHNYTGKTRQKSIQLRTTKGSIVIVTILVSQLSHKAYVSNDTLILTSAMNASVINGTLDIDDREVFVENGKLHV